MAAEEAAEGAQICSLCSFGEHGQTKRGTDLNPIACDRGSILAKKRTKKIFTCEIWSNGRGWKLTMEGYKVNSGRSKSYTGITDNRLSGMPDFRHLPEFPADQHPNTWNNLSTSTR